jgi:hypothetical protein
MLKILQRKFWISWQPKVGRVLPQQSCWWWKGYVISSPAWRNSLDINNQLDIGSFFLSTVKLSISPSKALEWEYCNLYYLILHKGLYFLCELQYWSIWISFHSYSTSLYKFLCKFFKCEYHMLFSSFQLNLDIITQIL